MKKFNLLMMITTWVVGHLLIHNVQRYLTETYEYNVPFIIVLFGAAVYAHYRLFTHMIFKVLSYL